MKNKNYITKTGLQKLKNELTELKTKKLPEIIEEIQVTRSLGDISENAGYHAAKEQQGFIQSRIDEIEEILKTAVVKKDMSTNKVGVGSKVFVTDTQTGNETVFEVVGASEADPINKKISDKSPLGEALMGKKQGDIAKFSTPIGDMSYKITKLQ